MASQSPAAADQDTLPFEVATPLYPALLTLFPRPSVRNAGALFSENSHRRSADWASVDT